MRYSYEIDEESGEIDYKIITILDKIKESQDDSDTANVLNFDQVNQEDTKLKIYTDVCVICKDAYNVILHCGHTLCIKCYVEWYVKASHSNNCVFCHKYFHRHQVYYQEKISENI